MTTALANSTQVTARYLRAFLRQPYYIAGTLVQPVIWLLLFGQLFKRATDIPGFAVDEPVESLCEHLKLPAFLEPHRKDIEGVLPSLERAA